MRPGGSDRVQVFGRRDSRPTQKALRFFADRRIPVSFVEVRARAPQIGELRRFVEGLGAEAVMETAGRRYRELGLGYMRLEPVDVLERLRDDPGLLRLPLVRFGNELAAGVDEQRWRTIATAVSTVSGGSSEQNR